MSKSSNQQLYYCCLLLLQPRQEEFAKYARTINVDKASILPNFTFDYGYVVYNARANGVSRSELVQILEACVMGDVIDRDMRTDLRHVRDEVYAMVIEGEHDLNVHFRKMLLRWLDNMVNHLNPTAVYGNLNDVAFPIPDDVRRDPSVLRELEPHYRIDGLHEWNYDTTVPECLGEYDSDDFEDDDDAVDVTDAEKVHEHFVSLCAGKRQITLETSIDGSVAWKEMESDVVKNDVTLSSQDAAIRDRCRRGALTEKRKQRREQQLTKRFCDRYCRDKSACASHVNFSQFSENITRCWDKFQSLVEN